MRQPTLRRRAKRNGQAGLTLIELVVTCGILLVLSSAALPMVRTTVKRQREAELRRSLREMRDAIDRYKDDADKNLIRTEVGSQNYPPDLDTLVMGVTISAAGGAQVGVSAGAVAGTSSTAQVGALPSTTSQSGSQTPSKVRYLRRIPIDPITGKAEWGLRAIQDDADSHSWGGHNVFDVYSMSSDKAIDGTNYEDW